MRLTTKMRYGSRAMVDLALHQGEEPVSLKEIAGRQAVSPKYMEQLLAALQSAGLTRAARGARGGWMLARTPSEITLRDLYEVLEGGGCFVPCTANPGVCARSPNCVTREVWASLYTSVLDILAGITVEDLATRARQKEGTSLEFDI